MSADKWATLLEQNFDRGTTSGGWVLSNTPRRFAEAARQSFGADLVVLFEIRSRSFAHVHCSGAFLQPQRMETILEPRRLHEWVVDFRQSLFIDDAAKHPGPFLTHSDFVRREAIRSVALLPLEVRTELVGVMVVAYRKPKSFGKEEQAAFSAFATGVAMGILEAREGARADVLAARRKASEAEDALRDEVHRTRKASLARQTAEEALELITEKVQETQQAHVDLEAQSKEQQELLKRQKEAQATLELRNRELQEQIEREAEAKRNEEEKRSTAEALREQFEWETKPREFIWSEARTLREGVEATRREPVLDADAQKARRNLVAMSGIAMALGILGLTTSEINVFGFKFRELEPLRIKAAAVAILTYLLFVFALKSIRCFRVRAELLRRFRSSARALDPTDGFLAGDPVLATYLREAPAGVHEYWDIGLSDMVLPLLLAVASIVTCFAWPTNPQSIRPSSTPPARSAAAAVHSAKPLAQSSQQTDR